MGDVKVIEWWVMKSAVMVLCLINATSAAPNVDVKLNKVRHTFPTLSRNSFLPYISNTSASCQPSLPAGERKGTSLSVIHKHGACSPQNLGHKSTTPRPTAVEILEQDKSRVESIRNQINPKRSKINRMSGETNVMLAAKFGGGNFMVTVGVGTPRRDLSLIFDTGSSFTWTQCEPCSGSCYKQEDPIFEPSQSSTYSNINCYSPICSKVRYSTTNSGCSTTSSTCMYDIEYMDKSYSVGFVSKDTLYLGPKDIVPNFIFGCGVDNQGLFDAQTAGLIGLGKSSFSLASQAASTYGNIFSYCLPSLSSSTGHLTLGNATLSSKAVQYTPLVPNARNPSFYFIELQGIMVGGRKLSLATTVFSTAGTIIDSGTVISRLPGTAYSALRDSFRQLMSKYPKAAPISFLDTCYDFTNHTDEDIIFPQISLLFGGGARLDLDAAGIFYVKDISQVCLAFAGNTNAGDVGVLGNMQQLTFDVVYDLAASRLGFGPAGCL